MSRREWWLEINSFGPGMCFNYEVKHQPWLTGTSVEGVIKVREVLPGDVLLSAGEAEEIRGCLTAGAPAIDGLKARHVLDRAMKQKS